MNPLLLSILSSLSTMIGSLFIFLKKNKNILCFSLSFASGVMLTVSFFDLIPESFAKITESFYIIPAILIILICFSTGVIISFLIDKYIPDNSNKIYRVGIISLIAIVIHNIPEGIATYVAGSVDIKLGITLAIAITLHNIPEGIAVAIPIYYATKNKFKAIFYTTFAGLSEMLGAIIAMVFFKNLISNLFIGLILSVIAGIMFQISLYELLPNALNIKKRRVGIYFLIGIIIMLLSIKLI